MPSPSLTPPNSKRCQYLTISEAVTQWERGANGVQPRNDDGRIDGIGTGKAVVFRFGHFTHLEEHGEYLVFRCNYGEKEKEGIFCMWAWRLSFEEGF